MKPSYKMILNTWGVFIYFFCQWLITVLVTRISGYEAAGQYSLAVSFTNVFSFLGMFGVRNLQVSDVFYEYSDGQYYAMRCVTCLVSVAAFGLVLPLVGYRRPIMICCIVMMLFKTVESAVDVTIGTMQRRERFDQVAVSYSLRGVLPAVAFTVVLLWKHSLPIAILAMSGASLLCMLLYDLPRIHLQPQEERRFHLKGTWAITKKCFPLMLTALLDSMLVYIPRDAVERTLGSEALGYYGTVSIIVVVLSTLGGGVWGSLMPRTSVLIQQRDHPAVAKLNKMVALGLAITGVVVLLAGNLLGPFFFRLLFGREILNYMFLLTPVLVNAILLLINSYFPCLFVPMGRRNILLYTNGAAAILCVVLSNWLVGTLGILGACLGLGISLTLRIVMLIAAFMYYWYIERSDPPAA